ncbi:hypothetical protein ACIQC8_00335 [Agrococcus sediminis]|uniref:hypothetical protein n=1 Tax=Agrococcus sediminis TaxID=2599924 RepID=UPI0037FD6455
MTDGRRPARARACGAGRGERIAQALVGLLLAAFAVDSLDQPLLAGAVGAFAALVLVGAVRGWCPGSLPMLLAARRAERPNRHGIPEARQDLLG